MDAGSIEGHTLKDEYIAEDKFTSQSLSLSLSQIFNPFFSLFFSIQFSMNNNHITRPQDQRSRFAKPATIHGCALSGDLAGLQRLLRDNPSLLNEKNPVVRSHFPQLGIFKMFAFLLIKHSKLDLSDVVCGKVCAFVCGLMLFFFFF